LDADLDDQVQTEDEVVAVEVAKYCIARAVDH
jgi:hypothetical protein